MSRIRCRQCRLVASFSYTLIRARVSDEYENGVQPTQATPSAIISSQTPCAFRCFLKYFFHWSAGGSEQASTHSISFLSSRSIAYSRISARRTLKLSRSGIDRSLRMVSRSSDTSVNSSSWCAWRACKNLASPSSPSLIGARGRRSTISTFKAPLGGESRKLAACSACVCTTSALTRSAETGSITYTDGRRSGRSEFLSQNSVCKITSTSASSQAVRRRPSRRMIFKTI